MKVKHTLASTKDKKPTVNHSELNNFISLETTVIKLCYYDDLTNRTASVIYHKSRNGKTWYADSTLPIWLEKPYVGKPVYLNVEKIVSKIITEITF